MSVHRAQSGVTANVVIYEVTMVTREFTNKGGETWTWDETPEVVAALKAYWAVVAENKRLGKT